VAFADFDNDGDLDIFESIGGFYEGDSYQSVLFENPGNGNHWTSLEPRRRKDQSVRDWRSHAGSGTDARRPRDIFRVVTSGGSFGDSPFRVHEGLERASAISEIEIRWPTSRTVQTFQKIPMDRSFRIRERDARLIPLNRKSFSFGAARMPAGAHSHR
jgi:hypothetical protein